jgi:hypothetical protein
MPEIFEKKRFERLLKWMTNSPGLFALAIMACLFLLTLLFITPVYDVNDDPAMAMVASGVGTIDGPDEHLIYTNVLIGKLLKQLYQSAPQIPWYGCYLLLVLFVAYWLLLYVLLLLDKNFFSLSGFLLFYLATGVYFLTHLQFTSSAFLLGLSGLSLILANLFLDTIEKKHRWMKWGGALCLIAASLIRYAAFQMLVLSSLPLLLIVSFHFFRQVKIRSYLAPAALIVIGVLGSSAYDRQYYQQDEGWQTYFKHLSATAEIINYPQIPYTDQTKPIFDKVGWSNYDFWMLKDWFYLDPETYSLARIQKFKELRTEFTLWKFPQVMHVRIEAAKAAFLNPTFLFCIVASLLIIRRIQRHTWQRHIVSGTLVWTVCIMLGLLIYMKLPERVFIPLASFPFFLSLFLTAFEFGQQKESESPHWQSVFRWGVPVLLLIACFLFWNQKQWSDQIVRINQRFKQDLKLLNQQLPKKVFLAWAPFPIDCFLPLDNQSEIKDFKHLWLTGRQSTPIFHQRQTAYQIKSAYTDLYETDRLLLISNPLSNRVLKGYLKQHYGVDVTFRVVLKGGIFRVYQVIRE